MRALGIVAILAIGLAGCGGDSGGGAVTATGITGTWHLDIDHLKAEVVKVGVTKEMEEQLAKLPEAARAAMEKARDEKMKALDSGRMTLVINGDGTYTADMVEPGSTKAETGKGTWKEADGGYLVQETHKDGKESKKDAFKARMEGGFLYAKPEAGMPFELRLKR